MGRQKNLDTPAHTVGAAQIVPRDYGIKTIDAVIDLLIPYGEAACVTPNSMAYALWAGGHVAEFCALLGIPAPKGYDAFREVAFAFFGQRSSLILDGLYYRSLKKQEAERIAALAPKPA